MKDLSEVLKAVGSTCGYDFGDNESTSLKDANQRNAFGDTPLHIVSGWGDAEAAAALIKAGADVNARGDEDLTPIYRAIAAGSLDTVKTLVAEGADLSSVTEACPMSPLRYAQVPVPTRPQTALMEIIEFLTMAVRNAAARR